MLDLLFLLTSEAPVIDETTIEESKTAVETFFNWVIELLNTPLFVVGGSTITGAVILGLLIKALIKHSAVVKTNVSQKEEIAVLNEEMLMLKAKIKNHEARTQTLEKKADVITKYTPNKKIHDAYKIKVEESELEQLQPIEQPKKVIKVKVKKDTKEVVDNG